METTSIIAILTISFGFTSIASEPRIKYGESCPADDWCDYGKWLWCHEGTCQCLHPKRQTFDLLHNRCVGQAGTECNVYIGDRDCTSHSFCEWNDGKGRCKCKPGFRVTDKRTCSRTGIHADEYSILNHLASENEIVVTSPKKPVTTTPSSRLLYRFNSSTSRSRYSEPFNFPTFLAPANTDTFTINSNNNNNNNFRDNSDIGESWRRLWSLILANRDTRIFFK